MAFRTRLRRLLRRARDGRRCECRTDQIVVRYQDDLGPPDDDRGTVCAACGPPRPPGSAARITINMPCRRADAPPG